MGIFADKCQALVDEKSGKALAGEALDQARSNSGVPRCGNRVPKAARFCNKCGSPAPGGWWKCPGCGKWVGNESNYCWNCKTDLHPDTRGMIAGGRWQKSGDVFAERFEVGDLRKLLEKGLIIETGTAAILMDGGEFKSVLAPGQHNLESMARTVNWWGSPPPRTVVLVDDSDVVVPLRIEDLRSSEEIPVEFYGEVCLRFDKRHAKEFVANLLKSAPRLAVADLIGVLRNEILYTVRNACTASTIEDLVKDPERRLHLEDALQETLKESCARLGLEVVRVPAVEFTGREYEELRRQAGDTELKRREIEFTERMRELLNRDRMGQFKSEQELEEYATQLAQERNISDEKRGHELGLLRQVQRHEIDAGEASHRIAQEQGKAVHEIGIKSRWDDYQRDKAIRDAASEKQVRAEKLAAEDAEVGKAIIWRKQKQDVDLEAKAKWAGILEGKGIETLIALVDDPDRREQLLEIQRSKQAAGKSAEEILALSAASNPGAAEALKELASMRKEELLKAVEMREKLSQEAAARLERVLRTALESLPKSGGQQGPTTVINK